MKTIAQLILALAVSTPLLSTVGCGDSNEPINVVEGQSREDLDAQAGAISSEYERTAEESNNQEPTAEEKAMNRS
ncbi:secreted protein [Rhodopirellula maiorica SM1]|uniref:Secreted protein n=1 Tax=Rhodopirellula maiorica SM1 TaxID=1265738 RepID=M5RF14_9BACT|nr:hypothetical protein [Rhodopirellula maiorica]EMI18063.1 secreted protein [Rhodopirellula maiorica SM1]